jgi:dipeptidyl aminopeptidase/acylaminoacyl peptidase
LILHGDKDETVLLDQSERLRDVYKKVGLDVTLVVVPGGQHNTDPVYFSGPNRRLTAEFLDKHLRQDKEKGAVEKPKP